MTVRNLIQLLLLNGNLDDEVIVFEQEGLYDGAEVISVVKTIDDEILLKVKGFEE